MAPISPSTNAPRAGAEHEGVTVCSPRRIAVLNLCRALGDAAPPPGRARRAAPPAPGQPLPRPQLQQPVVSTVCSVTAPLHISPPAQSKPAHSFPFQYISISRKALLFQTVVIKILFVFFSFFRRSFFVRGSPPEISYDISVRLGQQLW